MKVKETQDNDTTLRILLHVYMSVLFVWVAFSIITLSKIQLQSAFVKGNFLQFLIWAPLRKSKVSAHEVKSFYTKGFPKRSGSLVRSPHILRVPVHFGPQT